MKWQLLALWGMIFMTRYWIVKVVLSHLTICILQILLSTDIIIFLSYILNDDCGDQYKKASIGLLLFVILWT